ncbi:MAG: alpha/beta fold hydrolase [Myxococcota bacterium]|nr:alpha/beta fold hydrolase [Myxococcota bacterium]
MLLWLFTSCHAPEFHTDAPIYQTYDIRDMHEERVGTATLYRTSNGWQSKMEKGLFSISDRKEAAYESVHRFGRGFQTFLTDKDWVRRAGLVRTRKAVSQPLWIEHRHAATTPLSGGLAGWADIAQNIGDIPAAQAVWNLAEGIEETLYIDLIPNPSVQYNGRDVQRHFVRTAAHGRSLWLSEGKLLALSDQMSGISVVATDFEIPKESRPATPAHIWEETVVAKGEHVELYGSLSTPKASSAPLPGVLLIQGSGPTDRDGSNAAVDFGLLRTLAWYLNDQGFAVLRYDKRGVGESIVSDEAPKPLFTHLIEDAASMRDALKASPKVDATCLYVIGHSQGGFIAPEIAVGQPEIQGVILLGSAARPITEVLQTQLKAISKAHNLPEDQSRESERAQSSYLLSLEHKKGDFMKSWSEIDPSQSLRSLQSHVLAVIGEHDVQSVPSVEIPALEEALSANANATVTVLPELDHLMMQTEGVPGMGWYTHPSRVPATIFLETIGDWMRKNPCTPTP